MQNFWGGGGTRCIMVDMQMAKYYVGFVFYIIMAMGDPNPWSYDQMTLA